MEKVATFPLWNSLTWRNGCHERPTISTVLQGNYSLTSGVKQNSCYVAPNARSVFKVSKRKEMVIYMGKRNGTVASEQALSTEAYNDQLPPNQKYKKNYNENMKTNLH